MATTTGLVQKLTILPGSSVSMACVWIGPTPSDTELLSVQRSSTDASQVGAFKNSIVDALATAMVSRREVTVGHGDSDAIITSLVIDPV